MVGNEKWTEFKRDYRKSMEDKNVAVQVLKLEANIMKFEMLCIDNKEFVKSLKVER